MSEEKNLNEKNILHTKRYWALLGLIVGVLLIALVFKIIFHIYIYI